MQSDPAACSTVIALLCVQLYAARMYKIFASAVVDAANDAVAARTRTVPIPQSITPVPGYPQKLVVFKIAASRYWQMRCWIAGKTYRRSTKTTSLRAAQSAARQFFEQLLLTRYQSQHCVENDCSSDKVQAVKHKPTVMLFSTAAAQMYANEQARVDRGEYALGSLQVMRNRLDAHILPRFGKLPVSDIDYSKLLSFTQFLSKSYTTVTVGQYLIVMRKVLKLAVKTGQIPALPEFPTVKIINAPRASFTPSEYWQIMRAARRLTGQAHPQSARYLRSEYKLRTQDTRMPVDMSWAICFMVNAFIRPGDLHKLQHRHVEIVKHGPTQYLRLTLPETKRHAAPIVTLQPAVRVYQQMLKQRKPKPTDYLFLPQHKDRQYASCVLSTMFNWVLAETGLKLNAHGRPRTMYSLRHSAITFRLLYGSGIDILTLARNARTSVDIINKHYASTLTPEQNVQMLQSRRSKITS